jgi:hypothetical protein
MIMMTKLFRTTAVTLLFVLTAGVAQAQKVGIKTNLIYWGTATINAAVEVKLAPKTTIELVATGNPFVFGKRELNRKLWHWTAQPEIRFWQAEAFNRGFFGIHATVGSFDAGGIDIPLGQFPGFKDYRHEGWMAGIGASYGWQWYLSPHWNLEATFGFGYLYMEYDRFECVQCGAKLDNNVTKHYFGPTKVGVSFSYLIKSKK